jgi:hypothetical protein
LAARISKCVAFAGPTKCGGEKPHKGRSPTAVFCSPEPPLAAERIPACYMPLPPPPPFLLFHSIVPFIVPVNLAQHISNESFVIYTPALCFPICFNRVVHFIYFSINICVLLGISPVSKNVTLSRFIRF